MTIRTQTRFYVATAGLGLLWLAGMPLLFWGAGQLMYHESPYSTVRFADTLGNAIVVSSTAVLIAAVYGRLAGIARWASRLATLGAVVLVLSVAFPFAHDGRPPMFIKPGFADYQGMLSLLVAALVFWHVFMNFIQRDAVLGALIMTFATCVIGWEFWLLRQSAYASGISSEAFAYYWGLAFLAAQFVGYVAFGLATLAGANYLLGARSEAANPPRSGLTGGTDQWQLQARLTTAAGVGVPAFVVAFVFVIGWGWDCGTSHVEFWATALWLSGVTILYAVFLARLLWRQLKAPEAAWWSIGGFAALLAGHVALLIVLSVLASPGAP